MFYCAVALWAIGIRVVVHDKDLMYRSARAVLAASCPTPRRLPCVGKTAVCMSLIFHSQVSCVPDLCCSCKYVLSDSRKIGTFTFNVYGSLW